MDNESDKPPENIVDFVKRAKRDAEPAGLGGAPEISEDALALEFAAEHQDSLRYVDKWGKWLQLRGSKWHFDETRNVFTLARATCRKTAEGVTQKSSKTALGKAKTVAAVEQLARCDDRLKATVEQWDAHPWRANSPGGIVDLENGAMRPTLPEDYCTKSTAVAPAQGTPVLFLKFLERIMNGDKELIAFLQRVCGYSLTGSTVEHAIFFFYGTGANGKSVLLSTIAGILGDYHKTSQIQTFIDSGTTNHPTDIANLMGARLVTAVETEKGRRWAEAKLKNLTGGDKISGRFMRQDFFEFTPQFKLIVAGNHKPGLRTVDEAIRRRFHLVPFAVTIPEEERDLNLLVDLKKEWPQILAWMIRGCLEWQRVGLAPPAAVKTATEAYLTDQDSIAAWIEDKCETNANFTEPRTALFQSWKVWAETAGEFVGDQKTLFENLETRGFNQTRLHGGQRLFRGIKIKQTGTEWDQR